MIAAVSDSPIDNLIKKNLQMAASTSSGTRDSLSDGYPIASMRYMLQRTQSFGNDCNENQEHEDHDSEPENSQMAASTSSGTRNSLSDGYPIASMRYMLQRTQSFGNDCNENQEHEDYDSEAENSQMAASTSSGTRNSVSDGYPIASMRYMLQRTQSFGNDCNENQEHEDHDSEPENSQMAASTSSGTRDSLSDEYPIASMRYRLQRTQSFRKNCNENQEHEDHDSEPENSQMAASTSSGTRNSSRNGYPIASRRYMLQRTQSFRKNSNENQEHEDHDTEPENSQMAASTSSGTRDSLRHGYPIASRRYMLQRTQSFRNDCNEHQEHEDHDSEPENSMEVDNNDSDKKHFLEHFLYLGLAPQDRSSMERSSSSKRKRYPPQKLPQVSVQEHDFIKPQVFECDYCTKIFFSKMLHRRHTIQHLRVRRCSNCNESFEHKVNHRRHQAACKYRLHHKVHTTKIYIF